MASGFLARVQRPFNGGRNRLLDKWCQDSWLSTCKEQNWILTSHHIKQKNNSKWFRDLTARAKTTKLLEENMGINLHDLGLVVTS